MTIAPNLHWHDINVGDRLVQALGGELAVTVDNDANLGALAEYRVGEFAGTPNLVYIAGQTGVGGGLIVGGRLVRGAAGFAGEVGHMHVVDNGSECGCGRRGCWETLVGLRQLLRARRVKRVRDLDVGPACAHELDYGLGLQTFTY